VLAPEYKPENAVFAEKNAFSGRKVAKRSEKHALAPENQAADLPRCVRDSDQLSPA
jgi:hypothetical protein